jgi:hypothetical protein
MILPSDIDHGENIRQARAALKNVLKATFARRTAEDLAAIMKAFDALRVAERAADRIEWRDDLLKARAHEVAVAQAQAEAAANRKAARRIRGEPEPRTCTVCGKTEPDVKFYKDGQTKSGKPKKRPHCQQCEKDAGAEYRERQRQAAAADAEAALRRLNIRAVG